MDEEKKARSRATQKKYYWSNREASLERHRRDQRELKFKRPNFKLWSSAKRRAKQKGLEFDIEVSDILIPELCPILDIPLFFTEGQKTPNTPSVDRVDNSKGYIKGNVKVISQKANTLKSSATLEQVRRIVKYIEDNLKE